MEKCRLCNRIIWFWQKREENKNSFYVNVADVHLDCLIEEINDVGGCERCGKELTKDNWARIFDNATPRKLHFYHSICPEELE